MPDPSRAPDLIRDLGLSVDGPVLWGQPVRSRAAGLFVVEASAPSDSAALDFRAVRDWVERVPSLMVDGKRPTPNELEDRLSAFWLPGQTILYIGRTTKSLGPRVAAAYATRLGDRRPHAGGHWLKALRGLERLRVWWTETDAPEEYEDGLVSAFVSGLSAEARAGLHDGGVLLPWANLEAVTGERKKTGITGSLLEADADAPAGKAGAASSSKRPARATAGTRSSASGTSRARVTTSGTSSGRTGSSRAASSKPLPPPTHITAAGLASLNAELHELTRVERPAVIARVKHARELGDLRENADYEAARNEQSFLEGRIQSLEQLIKTAEVIGTDHTGEVMIGSTVRIEADGDEQTFRIVGSTEANPAAGRISNVSPVGKALVGRRAGDEVTIELPGSRQTYRIVEVR